MNKREASLILQLRCAAASPNPVIIPPRSFSALCVQGG